MGRVIEGGSDYPGEGRVDLATTPPLAEYGTSFRSCRVGPLPLLERSARSAILPRHPPMSRAAPSTRLRSETSPGRLAVKLAVKSDPKWSFGGRFEYVAS